MSFAQFENANVGVKHVIQNLISAMAAHVRDDFSKLFAVNARRNYPVVLRNVTFARTRIITARNVERLHAKIA